MANFGSKKLVIVGGAFFVVACVGSFIPIAIEQMNNPRLQQLFAEAVEVDRDKHKEQQEEKYLARIKSAAKDSFDLMDDHFEYGEWLFTADREDDAIKQYQLSIDVAKKRICEKWTGKHWIATCHQRQAAVAHRAFIRTGKNPPDPALIEEAIKSLDPAKPEEKPGFLASWLMEAAMIYADNGRFKEANETIDRSIAIRQQIKSDSLADSYEAKAQILLRQRKPSEAIKILLAANPKQEEGYDTIVQQLTFAQTLDKPGLTIGDEAARLFAQSDFAGLDQMAAQLRKTNDKTVSGFSYLELMRSGLEIPEFASDKLWEEHLSKLKTWVTKNPDSPTARVVLADAFTAYAWRARGSGYSDTISEEGSQKFDERLEEGRKILDEEWTLQSRCPDWYTVRQRIALGQGMEKEQYNHMVAECRKDFPDYFQPLLGQSWFLQPRWYGEDGEWNKVASTQCTALGGTKGDALYAQIVWYLSDYYRNVFREANADWPRTKRGLAALAKQYPDSIQLKLITARLAALANDQTLLTAMIK